MQCFFSGGREQLVENTGRELPSQHRTVGDNAIGVVDKRYAVNPSYGVDPENSVDTFRFEQLSELVPCVMRAHGVFDRLPQTIERARLFQVVFRHPVILLKGLIADILSDTTRLEWRADAVSVVGQGTVDYSGIVPSVDGARAFLNRDVEQFQQRAELAVGRAFVIPQARPDDG
mgnify:FL=1